MNNKKGIYILIYICVFVILTLVFLFIIFRIDNNSSVNVKNIAIDFERKVNNTILKNKLFMPTKLAYAGRYGDLNLYYYPLTFKDINLDRQLLILSDSNGDEYRFEINDPNNIFIKNTAIRIPVFNTQVNKWNFDDFFSNEFEIKRFQYSDSNYIININNYLKEYSKYIIMIWADNLSYSDTKKELNKIKNTELVYPFKEKFMMFMQVK